MPFSDAKTRDMQVARADREAFNLVISQLIDAAWSNGYAIETRP
jgi:hypothetical protein